MKRSNMYTEAIGGKLFEQCPKHVFAAMALSALTVGGDHINWDDTTENDTRLISEWWSLYRNGIVPQKPPFADPSA